MTPNYYLCDLKTGNHNCPRADMCKRHVLAKDIPYNEYQYNGFARLYNVCERTNFSLFLQMPPAENPPQESNKEEEKENEINGTQETE